MGRRRRIGGDDGGAPGGSDGYCSQGTTYRGTDGEICGGDGNWGAMAVEVWYPICVEDADCEEAVYCAAFQSWPQLGACLPTDGEIAPASGVVGRTIGEAAIRSRTGVSIVAVVRDGQTIPSPPPGHTFEIGDIAVAVGTPDGIGQVRALLA